jgi:hypothetical protein
LNYLLKSVYNIVNCKEASSPKTTKNGFKCFSLVTNMKNELKNFLKSQLDNSKTNEDGNRNGTEISALDYMSNSNSYSTY